MATSSIQTVNRYESDRQDQTGARRQTKSFQGIAGRLFGARRGGQGKRTLRTHAVEYKPAPKVLATELIRVREHLKFSRDLFAAYLRTNVRTLENWEQGRAKPNAQAVLLINLVKQYPDTVERLASI